MSEPCYMNADGTSACDCQREDHDYELTVTPVAGEGLYFHVECNDCKTKNVRIAELEAELQLACVELTEYERSDLEQSSSDGILPLTPNEWRAALRRRTNEETP